MFGPESAGYSGGIFALDFKQLTGRIFPTGSGHRRFEPAYRKFFHAPRTPVLSQHATGSSYDVH